MYCGKYNKLCNNANEYGQCSLTTCIPHTETDSVSINNRKISELDNVVSFNDVIEDSNGDAKVFYFVEVDNNEY